MSIFLEPSVGRQFLTKLPRHARRKAGLYRTRIAKRIDNRTLHVDYEDGSSDDVPTKVVTSLLELRQGMVVDIALPDGRWLPATVGIVEGDGCNGRFQATLQHDTVPEWYECRSLRLRDPRSATAVRVYEQQPLRRESVRLETTLRVFKDVKRAENKLRQLLIHARPPGAPKLSSDEDLESYDMANWRLQYALHSHHVEHRRHSDKQDYRRQTETLKRKCSALQGQVDRGKVNLQKLKAACSLAHSTITDKQLDVDSDEFEEEMRCFSAVLKSPELTSPELTTTELTSTELTSTALTSTELTSTELTLS